MLLQILFQLKYLDYRYVLNTKIDSHKLKLTNYPQYEYIQTKTTQTNS